MRCPIDGTELKIAERQGVEIDYCPQCRGVWLDRGELDKIVERSGLVLSASAGAGGDTGHEARDPQQRRKPRENFLLDLFDF